MRDVNVNPTDIIDRKAAGTIIFGALVKRSAAGTIVSCVDGANTRGYDGIAMQDAVEHDPEGMYATYDDVPVISGGRVNVWVQGGGTDITSGNFLKIANDFGILALDHATTVNASTTVVKAQEDIEVSDYTTAITTAVAGSKTLIVASTANMLAGDYLYLASTEGYEVKVIDIVDSTTQVTLKEAAVYSHATGPTANVLVQCEAVLL